MSEPQKSRSIQRREAIQRGEEMPTFSGPDNTPDPPAAPPMSVEQALRALKDAAYEWGGEPYDETVAPAVDALISAVRAEKDNEFTAAIHSYEQTLAQLHIKAQNAEHNAALAEERLVAVSDLLVALKGMIGMIDEPTPYDSATTLAYARAAIAKAEKTI